METIVKRKPGRPKGFSPKKKNVIEGEVILETSENDLTEIKPIRKSRASWKPANLVEIPKEFREPGKVYYLANVNHTGRVQQKLREGWQINKSIVPKMRKAGYLLDMPATLQDGQPKDDTLRFRELICLETTQENADAREEYYRSLDPLKKAQNQLHKETGGRDYGEVRINR